MPIFSAIIHHLGNQQLFSALYLGNIAFLLRGPSSVSWQGGLVIKSVCYCGVMSRAQWLASETNLFRFLSNPKMI